MKKVAFFLILTLTNQLVIAQETPRAGIIANDEQRADIFLKKGDWPNLLTHASYWAQKYPGESKAWHYLGIAQKTLGKTEDAANSLTRAWKLSDKQNYALISDVGDMYVQQKNWELAEDAYRKALNIKKHVPDMWNKLVDVIFAYPHPSQTENAAAALKQLLAFPDYKNQVKRWQQYATAIDELGMDDGMVYNAYSHVVRLQPQNVNAWEKIYAIDLANGNIEKAENILYRILKIDSKNAIANVYFGQQALQDNNPEIAQKYFGVVLEHTNLPKRLRATTLTALGNLYSEKKNLSKALEQYRLSIAADPTYLPPWEQVIAILRNRGNTKEAQEQYEKMLAVERQITAKLNQ